MSEPTTTYTREQVDLMLQQEGDRRVTTALKTAKESWEIEQKRLLDEQRESITREMEERSKLTAEELAKKEFEDRTKALEERERGVDRKVNLLNAQTALIAAGIPKDRYESMLEMLVADDTKKTEENVKHFVDLYNSTKKEIESSVRSELAVVPKPETNPAAKSTTKEDFDKMTYAAKLQFKKDNPELYAKFMK